MRPLEGVRVLDLSDGGVLLAGRVLADLGADVVQVEPLEGSKSRRVSPRHPNGDGSYYWDAYAANKRGVAVDIQAPDGQEAVRALAAVADVVIDSAGPWVQGPRHLDWDDLHAVNPGLVYLSITPFGRTGPKAQWADSDLVLWAAGGVLDEHRDGDRPPLRISLPQSYLHAALDGVAAVQIALLSRSREGEGQLIDVSVQAVLGAATLGHVLAHANGDTPRDMSAGHTLEAPVRIDQSGSGTATDPKLKKWECLDGIVEFHIGIGPASGGFTNNFWAWMSSEDVDLGDDASLDFRQLPTLIREGSWSDEDTDRIRGYVREFLGSKTKAEILQAALDFKLLCVPIYSTSDVRESVQLNTRGYWARVGEGDRQVLIPGNFAHTSDPLTAVTQPAPLLGEHDFAAITEEWSDRSAPVGDIAAASSSAALEGLKVVDFSWVVAGPVIGRTLADFGATVVRIESSTRVETARYMQPYIGGELGPERSALYGQWNAGKLGVTLDLQSESGREVARDLIRWADVVIESFSPGLMKRWGLDYEAVSKDQPDLIMLSTSINGQTGPLAKLAGYGNIGAALSGYQAIVGYPDGGMIGPFGPYTDYIGPRFATAALLGAVERQRQTGAGTYIDVSQVEAGVWLQAPQIADNAANGTIVERIGNRDRDIAPHGVYATAVVDRFVVIAATTDEQWRALAAEMGRPDLADRADLTEVSGRLSAQAELDDAISEWASTVAAEEIEARLQARRIPAHRSSSSKDFCKDEQLAHRGHLVTLAHPLFGDVVVEGPRMQLSGTPGTVRRAAPTFGQDNERVLRDVLGYDEGRVSALQEEGVLR